MPDAIPLTYEEGFPFVGCSYGSGATRLGWHGVARRREEASVGLIPIFDRNDHPIGVVTDRDLVIEVVAQDASAVAPVETAMSIEVQTVLDDDELQEAWHLMQEHHMRRLVICDRNGRTIGVLGGQDACSSYLKG